MSTQRLTAVIQSLAAAVMLVLCFALSGMAWVGAAAGGSHTAAIAEDGTVWASGANWEGALGDGTKTNSALPVQAVGLDGVVSIAAGDLTTVAIKQDGTVWTWGLMFSSPTADRTVPTRIEGMTGVLRLDAGTEHTLALKEDGTVWAWGMNFFGQFGSETTPVGGAYTETPVQATGLSGVTAISAGFFHSLAVKGDGTVWAWGDNSYGKCGVEVVLENGLPPMEGPVFLVPTLVQGIQDMVQVAGGWDHSLALKRDGTVWAWGSNFRKQLGLADTNYSSNVPQQVSGLSGIVAIAAGAEHSLALKEDGTVWAWGYNWYGQLGDGLRVDSAAPVQVVGLETITSISAGRDHSIALGADGRLWVWGASGYGQLGAGEMRYTQTPVWLPYSGGVSVMGVGYRHYLIRWSSDSVYAFGDNTSGQLGASDPNLNNTSGIFWAPIQLAGGELHSVGLKATGEVWTWGGNQHGQLGLGTTTPTSTPAKVAIDGVSFIAAGMRHTLAVRSGGVWAWGDNSSGQLGDGTVDQRNSPLQVAGLSGIVKVAGGEGHSLALGEDGSVYQWGAATRKPVKISALASVVDIAAGGNQSLAVKSDGTVWSWLADSTTPAQVAGIQDVVKVAAGNNHALAIKTDGSVWSWGANNRGQLGDGTIDERATPVRVMSPITYQDKVSPAVAVYAAGDNSYILTAEGWMKGWGDGYDDQFVFVNVAYYQPQTLNFGVTNYSAPDLAPVADRTAVVGRLLSFKAIASDLDGNSLTFSAEGLPAGASLDAKTGAVSFNPGPADVGTHNLKLNVTDDGLPEPITVGRAMTLNVVALNRPPVLDALAPVTASIGQVVSFTVRATDPDGDNVTLHATGLPSGSRFDPATGLFTWVPRDRALDFFGGVYTPRFWATDSGSPAKTVTRKMSITLLPGNHAPVIATIDPVTVATGTAVSFTVMAADPDGDPVTLYATGLPSGSRFDPATGLFTWTPRDDQAQVHGGVFKTRFFAADGNAHPLTSNKLVTMTLVPRQ